MHSLQPRASTCTGEFVSKILAKHNGLKMNFQICLQRCWSCVYQVFLFFEITKLWLFKYFLQTRCFYFAVKSAMSIGKNPKPHVDNPRSQNLHLIWSDKRYCIWQEISHSVWSNKKYLTLTCSQIFFMVGVWLSGVFIFAGALFSL